MREIKPGLTVKDQRKTVVLNNIPHYQGLVIANRFLLLLASTLMLVIFISGFFLLPENDPLENFSQSRQDSVLVASALQNPVLSAEINVLKGQLVGLLSGSIESKLNVLEESIKTGAVTDSLTTIQGLKSDVIALRTYSDPVVEKHVAKSQSNEALIKEISYLKNLVYLTLTSCGLMIAAIGGFLIRKHYYLNHPDSIHHLGEK